MQRTLGLIITLCTVVLAGAALLTARQTEQQTTTTSAAKPVTVTAVPTAGTRQTRSSGNPVMPGGLPLPVTSAGASYVGSEACSQCHYDKFVSYMNQPHSLSGDPRTPGSRFGCESSHGPGSNHVTGGGGGGVGGLMNFTDVAPVKERNAVCLQCHTRGKTALWHGSTHDQRKIACMDCHAVHGGNHKLLQQPTEQQLCTKCHQQVRTAMMKASHHPLREGKMQCTSCHNPHGTQSPRLISANSINDKCAECHTEKRGPFLFEHPPVRVFQETVLKGADDGLANVFVMVKGSFPQSPAPSTPVVIDQRGCLYHPRVQGARVGQTLEVKNSDKTLTTFTAGATRRTTSMSASRWREWSISSN